MVDYRTIFGLKVCGLFRCVIAVFFAHIPSLLRDVGLFFAKIDLMEWKDVVLMKKIAMLNCLNSNRVCAGAACMNALNNRKASFETYNGEEVELVAFMRCNGCGKELEEDAGMQEKLERLISIGTDILHIGVCTNNKQKEECALITAAADIMESKGVKVVRGTH